MTRVRLGAVGYLNARPCVVGLDEHPRFDLRFDVPAQCARLLHERAVDVGLIPAIEYLRAPGEERYRIVPGVAIGSLGPVASVAIYTRRSVSEIRSIALDSSSRTSVALTRVLCARAFGIQPELVPSGPDLSAMLERCDAALLIGDVALLTERTTSLAKIDLGETWTRMTGLPFVYAFWAGRADVLTAADVRSLQEARDAGVSQPEQVASAYYSDPALRAIGAQYLRDNIRYELGDAELDGLRLFFRYAAELELVPAGELQFY
ncbi:MAG: menaquinone biosynthesis protein [Acidobacteriota bacterium]